MIYLYIHNLKGGLLLLLVNKLYTKKTYDECTIHFKSEVKVNVFSKFSQKNYEIFIFFRDSWNQMKSLGIKILFS